MVVQHTMLYHTVYITYMLACMHIHLYNDTHIYTTSMYTDTMAHTYTHTTHTTYTDIMTYIYTHYIHRHNDKLPYSAKLWWCQTLANKSH